MVSEQDNFLERFPYPTKPETFMKKFEFPGDVTVLSSEEIGALRSKIGAYRGYILSQWAKNVYKTKIFYRDHRLKIAEESSKIDARTQKAAEEQAMLLPEIREMGDDLNEKTARAEFYELLEKSYDTYMDILSRELTRRQSLKERE